MPVCYLCLFCPSLSTSTCTLFFFFCVCVFNGAISVVLSSGDLSNSSINILDLMANLSAQMDIFGKI